MGFGINMSKAKDIHRDNIREARKDKILNIKEQQRQVQIPLILLLKRMY